jgi:two-component system, NtrC family, response regulator
MHSVLLVEDNQPLRENMKWALSSEYAVFEADSSRECLKMFEQHFPDVICLDMGLDGEPFKGLQIMDEILLRDRFAKIIVITANSSADAGPTSVQKGAFDFFVKPVDVESLKVIIKRALQRTEFEKTAVMDTADEESGTPETELNIVGQSNVMKAVLTYIRKLAKTDVTVLITGESGTGKEVCARAIHYLSSRKNSNFVPINCGAIPENLIESELFGYVKGAFTGAVSSRDGLIKSADGGTLLLDEIGEMPAPLQVKLLRFLEDQHVQRIGDTALQKVDVRIVAATNRKNLEDENSSLRSDLYYRLSEFHINLPPLRDREGDVVLLANSIIEKNRKKFGSYNLKLSDRAQSALLGYSWPGNIRELENKLSRASIICSNQIIEPEDLQLFASETMAHSTLKEARTAFERQYLMNLLQRVDYNISEAAQIAGVSRPTLYDLMKKCEIHLETQKRIRD